MALDESPTYVEWHNYYIASLAFKPKPSLLPIPTVVRSTEVKHKHQRPKSY